MEKRHSWSGGTEQHCINAGCRWNRRWLPSALLDGETKRRPEYFRDEEPARTYKATPRCGAPR